MLEHLDGPFQRFLNILGSHVPARPSEVSQTFCAFLNQFDVVISLELSSHIWYELIDVHNNLGLLRHVKNLVQGQKDTKLVLFAWILELSMELFENLVSLFWVLLEVLEEFVRSLVLDLGVFRFEVFPDIGQFHVGVLLCRHLMLHY